ncbi:MAG: hypothetical protein KGL99_15650 [Burkholderiales bacterium]|nr:hypothetical protein [Burkholderiales bacterium]
MLRALVLALLLANVAFYAWTQGWLDAVVGVRASGDREPERLARQVRPEIVRIVPASAASAPAAGALACLEAGPFADAELAAAQAAARAALPSAGWTTVPAAAPAAWIVYMGPYPNRAALSQKEDELKRRALAYEELRDDPALAPGPSLAPSLGLSLGRYDQRASATDALQRLVQQGVRSARVVELAAPASRHWLRIDHADAALAAQLTALKAPAFGNGFAACAAKAPTAN